MFSALVDVLFSYKIRTTFCFLFATRTLDDTQQIPPELVKMAEEFQAKVDSGQARKASSGFSGKGFTFDDSEQSESQQVTTRNHLVGGIGLSGGEIG